VTAELDDTLGIVALTAATEFTKRGLTPIPVAYRTKRPCIEGWPAFDPSAEALHREFGAGLRNIGLVLGRRSGGAGFAGTPGRLLRHGGDVMSDQVFLCSRQRAQKGESSMSRLHTWPAKRGPWTASFVAP